MATFSLSSFLNITSVFFILCSLDKCFVQSRGSLNSYAVQLTSLLPSSTCNPSLKEPTHKATLKVVHRHGPCSHLRKVREDTTGLVRQILIQDLVRVESIRARLAHPRRDGKYEQTAAAATLPAKSGAALGFANYFVTVGLGTPKRDLSLVFDTGSDLTWTQCEPCAGHCYPQKEAIFDPSASSSYANQSCSSPACSNLRSTSSCPDATSTCIYGLRYGDNSITEGYLATETLTLTTSNVIDKFLFGCGQNNDGLFFGIAGLLGLGRGTISIVQQASQTYNRLFSYCLPSASSSTGYLTLGAAGAQATPQYTPMLTLSQGESFYGFQISGISVGGRQLTEAEPALSSAKTILDSGTVITRLPTAAYEALKAEFSKHMAEYPPAASSPSGLLDTCYDLSGAATNGTVAIPKVSLSLGGGATVDLLPWNILFGTSAKQLCLAFAAGDGLSIFGNVQQKGFDVVYDVGGARIGFSSDGC